MRTTLLLLIEQVSSICMSMRTTFLLLIEQVSLFACHETAASAFLPQQGRWVPCFSFVHLLMSESHQINICEHLLCGIIENSPLHGWPQVLKLDWTNVARRKSVETTYLKILNHSTEATAHCDIATRWPYYDPYRPEVFQFWSESPSSKIKPISSQLGLIYPFSGLKDGESAVCKACCAQALSERAKTWFNFAQQFKLDDSPWQL